jgi:hypothetical protein
MEPPGMSAPRPAAVVPQDAPAAKTGRQGRVVMEQLVLPPEEELLFVKIIHCTLHTHDLPNIVKLMVADPKCALEFISNIIAKKEQCHPEVRSLFTSMISCHSLIFRISSEAVHRLNLDAQVIEDWLSNITASETSLEPPQASLLLNFAAETALFLFQNIYKRAPFALTEDEAVVFRALLKEIFMPLISQFQKDLANADLAPLGALADEMNRKTLLEQKQEIDPLQVQMQEIVGELAWLNKKALTDLSSRLKAYVDVTEQKILPEDDSSSAVSQIILLITLFSEPERTKVCQRLINEVTRLLNLPDKYTPKVRIIP